MPQLAIEGGFLAPRPAAAPPSSRKPGGDFGAVMSAAERPQQAQRPERSERPEAARERESGVSESPPEATQVSEQPKADAPPEEAATDAQQDAAHEGQASETPGQGAEATVQPEVNLQVQVAMLQLPVAPAAAAATGPTATAQAPAAAAAVSAALTVPQVAGQVAAQVAAQQGPGASVRPTGQPAQAAASPLAQVAQAVNVQAVEGGPAQPTGQLAAPVNPFLNWVEAPPEVEAAPLAMGSITPVQMSDEALSLETSALATAVATEDTEPAPAAPAEASSGPTALNAAPAEKAGAAEAGRATAQAPAQPARPEEVLPQILKQAELMKAQQQNTIKLQLYPEHLGKLEIKVMAHQGVLSAQLTADSAQVKGLLETQLAGLQRSLQELGLKVDRVEVALSSAGLGGFDMAGSGFADPRGQGSGQQPAQAPRFAGGYDGWAGGEEAAVAAAAYAPGHGSTAIDYVA